MDVRRRDVRYLGKGGNAYVLEWLQILRDNTGRIAILARIDRLSEGNFGDHCSVGGGVWELRVDFGPGYRIYYGEDGPTIILLICGGDKSTQTKDIRKAQEVWAGHRRSK